MERENSGFLVCFCVCVVLFVCLWVVVVFFGLFFLGGRLFFAPFWFVGLIFFFNLNQTKHRNGGSELVEQFLKNSKENIYWTGI